jgi:hypothetical protein
LSALQKKKLKKKILCKSLCPGNWLAECRTALGLRQKNGGLCFKVKVKVTANAQRSTKQKA